ncbi:MAG TPA: hypothetical protein VGH38_28695 [Bryobacteraceae bacterium]
MMTLLTNCLAQDEAQDLVEYSLLVAFIFFTVAGLVIGIGESVHTITSISNSQLSAAKDQVH